MNIALTTADFLYRARTVHPSRLGAVTDARHLRCYSAV
jgi:hypothetical protein